MSAPTTSQRAVGTPTTRPTRPVPRTPPARTAPARSAPVRTTQARTSQARTSQARTTAVAASGARSPGPTTVGATALALPRVSGRPDPGPAAGPRSRIRVLERPRTADRRVGFALTCSAMLGALMLGLLLLNVAISGNAFTVADLQSQRSVLVDQEQSLSQQLLVQGAPSALAARARGLGMVPAPQVIVLAPDGTGAPPPTPVP